MLLFLFSNTTQPQLFFTCNVQLTFFWHEAASFQQLKTRFIQNGATIFQSLTFRCIKGVRTSFLSLIEGIKLSVYAIDHECEI